MNKLGFGFLRLPGWTESAQEIDLALLDQMVDAFLAGGKRYFDTAYTYLDGKSEWAIRESLVRRHPRDSFILADKLPGYLAQSRADCGRFFDEQCRRCGVEYFDVFLLHWLNEEHYQIAERYAEFDFLRRLKETGRVRRTGFSYHGTADLLDTILTRHPEVDYVQLQINYLDWESEAIQSRRCYEAARRHGKPIVVMEPVKGGTLARLPAQAAALLQTLSPAASAASYALRFAQSLPGVEIVLSGMNQMQQLAENLRDTPPLSERERQTLLQAAALISGATAVPCTGCGYCLRHCPRQIDIPGIFRLYNEYARDPQEGWKIIPVYRQKAGANSRAADCLQCGACARNCPQHLPVPQHLADIAAVFDKG